MLLIVWRFLYFKIGLFSPFILAEPMARSDLNVPRKRRRTLNWNQWRCRKTGIPALLIWKSGFHKAQHEVPFSDQPRRTTVEAERSVPMCGRQAKKGVQTEGHQELHLLSDHAHCSFFSFASFSSIFSGFGNNPVVWVLIIIIIAVFFIFWTFNFKKI